MRFSIAHSDIAQSPRWRWYFHGFSNVFSFITWWVPDVSQLGSPMVTLWWRQRYTTLRLVDTGGIDYWQGGVHYWHSKAMEKRQQWDGGPCFACWILVLSGAWCLASPFESEWSYWRSCWWRRKQQKTDDNKHSWKLVIRKLVIRCIYCNLYLVSVSSHSWRFLASSHQSPAAGDLFGRSAGRGELLLDRPRPAWPGGSLRLRAGRGRCRGWRAMLGHPKSQESLWKMFEKYRRMETSDEVILAALEMDFSQWFWERCWLTLWPKETF